MSERIHSEFLTKNEEKLLTAMLGVDTLKLAAQKAGIVPHTAYNIVYRMRQSYKKCRGRANVIDAQKRRGGLFKKVLTDRMSAPMECPYCGGIIHEKDETCPNCGEGLD